ncbi:MAG TPA: aminofutalosine synthase MqnE [Bacteroidia bacterium]|nr:aminofutalosine synthase MqnE [Bacteroidia bacterium]
MNPSIALPSFLKDSSVTDDLKNIAFKIEAGERITAGEGLLLFEKGEIGFLATLANIVRGRKNGNYTYFNRNFHIEPTNVCVFTCRFCSYSRLYKNREQGWELSKKEMLDRVNSYNGIPVTEVHIVGGVHPKLDLDFFCDVISEIKNIRPGIHVKAFTAVELDYMIRKAKLSYEEGLKKLIASGLDSIPGGGAEIFDETVREEICADKCTSEQWLEIHETAHRLGLHSNATMLYGHIENYAHRVDHLNRLRELQDKTGGFNTFIPLKFRNKDNDMSHIKESTMIEDLKNYAVSRIYLDNFQHIKAYWPMIGRSTAQLAQSFGVDDIDGTIDDSTKIYTMAGAEEQSPALTTQQLVQLIKDVGRIPVERDSLYKEIRNYKETKAEPDFFLS